MAANQHTPQRLTKLLEEKGMKATASNYVRLYGCPAEKSGGIYFISRAKFDMWLAAHRQRTRESREKNIHRAMRAWCETRSMQIDDGFFSGYDENEEPIPRHAGAIMQKLAKFLGGDHMVEIPLQIPDEDLRRLGSAAP